MSRSSGQCDQAASYMDGVQVKIAEAYKPPRKFGLPAAYNNKFPDVSKYDYDFSLERSVLEKVTELRKARQANAEARRSRLERRRKRELESTTPSPPSPDDAMIPLPIKVAPAPETTILTPQPLSPPHSDLHNIDIHVKYNRLNYEDFYNDTSSPFDNVELKTINDMEELAQVLQSNSQWTPAPKIESILKELSIEESPEEKKDEIENKADDNYDKPQGSECRNISIIVEELQRTLQDRPCMDNWKPWPDLESPDPETTPELKKSPPTAQSPSTLPNPLAELSESDQKLAKHLKDMGFPLSRSARAIKNLGSADNKKVVEYLLAIQSLEESGISGDDAEKAMDVAQHDLEMAKKYYEDLSTLKDLGFPEDEASKALVKCHIDRDKALDFLCA
ncbi:uncharacterized protein [Fopius arisanus]|uniref:Ubiquitin-associated protein 1 n=1 Tax=Fopius arisanus TaxID=64838 RepID=A0A9R1TUL9_9HYME|nr:PREDICTED: uncharacterized protein LOC105262967 [Fopius arisanus]XP_011297189.1 PREDICTED: uncharacterized protein LOC105262967 [Fopius arisanus]